MTGDELLVELRQLQRSGLGVPHGRARFRRPNDLALQIRLDHFVEANGGEIVTIQLPESKGLRPGRLLKAPRANELYYEVPVELVD